MRFTFELNELRERALEALNIPDAEHTFDGGTTMERLCACIEPNEVYYKFRMRNYHVIQINPDGTHYAFCLQGNEVCLVKNDILPTEVLCILADALDETMFSYDFEDFKQDTCYTDRYQNKYTREIWK